MDDFARLDQDGFDVGQPPVSRPSFPPSGSALVNSYAQDALNGFEGEKPRTNPMNPGRLQSSTFVNLKDSVQVHLLTETALFDSKEYVILSEDEVDKLKKTCQSLTQRIEQARSNLTIQSKYRDAAVSVTRLYSPTGRSSLSGDHASGGNDDAREAEAERDAIQKKCEDLAMELWSLEQLLIEPQRKLLEHTAGILQHAHKAAQKTKTASTRPALINGVPASPESMYTTSNGRNSLDFLEDGIVFDEASLYRSFDMTEILGTQTRQNPIGIPLKSPVREQNKQLVEETDKLRQENDQLRGETETLLAEVETLKAQGSDQYKLISDMEQKLEKFNHQLREVLVKGDPTKDDTYDPVPSGQQESGSVFDSHMGYLKNALLLIGESNGDTSEVALHLQSLNAQLQDIITSVHPSHPQPPISTDDVGEQIEYLRISLQVVNDQFARATDAVQSTSVSKNKSDQAEAVLMGLWEIIQAGYADIRQRKQERRNARLNKGLEPDEEDISDADSTDLNEPYSLPAFSSKIQWLYTQATRLNEQKFVLKRQIKQQRELNSKSDSEKDQQLHDKDSELEEANTRLDRAEREADNLRTQLSQVYEDLENHQNGRSEEATVIEESREQLKQRNDKIATLEAETKEMQTRLAATEANMEVITGQLRDATSAKNEAERAAEEKASIIRGKEQELEQMTGMFAELKMETAMTKAELDGAYGTRKERAAEVAKLHDTSQSARMKSRVETLEHELMATANDLSDVVKVSVESEKKIGELEEELDKVTSERNRIKDEQEKMNTDLEKQLRDATTELEERMEAEVARLRGEKEQLQEELDKHRFTAGNGTTPLSGASKASYLTDSYRAGLRAERKKYDEQLKAEYATRRKLEDELRSLKRAQGPGKNTLSPR